MMDNLSSHDDTNWLVDILEEVGLRQFHTKLTKELQLTKLSHFDYVGEEDLMEIGLSRPAAKRLLAAIKKRKSFVAALKNKIVNKLIPSSSSSTSASIKYYSKYNHDSIKSNDQIKSSDVKIDPNPSLGNLTCLIKSQDIAIKEDIGHGAHGFVKKGKWTTPDCRVVKVAIKILREDVIAEPGASFSDFVKEISVMHQLDHPNIIKLFGIVLSSPMMMVLELAPYGNLCYKLRTEKGQTSISQLINYGVQISSGMVYLESKRFVHGDLTARNILISHGKKILIGDLGLMRAVPSHENHYIMSERTKIPFQWCAPESLRYKQFSSASDVYMFGVTLWEMFTFGAEPWPKLNLDEILENISSQDKRLNCPKACPAMVYQTLLQCWNTDPTLRPKFSILYQYLSTSYPLEVRAIQKMSNLDYELSVAKNSSSHLKFILDSLLNKKSPAKNYNILTCYVDDRILVINGQPGKYWWYGQNQRSFQIGWFALCSTVWVVYNKKIISKPLKNSFIHTGHCGAHGRSDNPKFNHKMYHQTVVAPDLLDVLNGLRLSSESSNSSSNAPKQKTKSKLSRLFGINDSSQNPNLINHAYRKFNNEPQKTTRVKGDEEIGVTSNLMTRSQSKDFKPLIDDEPLLIDLSGENPLSSQIKDFPVTHNPQPETLMNIDANVPVISEIPQKRASESNLNQLDDLANYHLSWAGSWNTGTFNGSNGNIYSAYYCPTDAAAASASQTNHVDSIEQTESNGYYSAPIQDEKLG